MIPVYGICGNSGEGKTRLVSMLLAEAKQQRWNSRGVFCPAVFEDGIKIAIDVCLIPGLQTRNLARLANSGDTDIIGKWKMNQESIAWVRAYLLDLQPADLWIVDEIGPYEIVQGKGWADIQPLLAELPAKKVLVTFRPSLLPWFQERFPKINITRAGHAESEAALLKSLFRQDRD